MYSPISLNHLKKTRALYKISHPCRLIARSFVTPTKQRNIVSLNECVFLVSSICFVSIFLISDDKKKCASNNPSAFVLLVYGAQGVRYSTRLTRWIDAILYRPLMQTQPSSVRALIKVKSVCRYPIGPAGPCGMTCTRWPSNHAYPTPSSLSGTKMWVGYFILWDHPRKNIWVKYGGYRCFTFIRSVWV